MKSKEHSSWLNFHPKGGRGGGEDREEESGVVESAKSWSNRLQETTESN